MGVSVNRAFTCALFCRPSRRPFCLIFETVHISSDLRCVRNEKKVVLYYVRAQQNSTKELSIKTDLSIAVLHKFVFLRGAARWKTHPAAVGNSVVHLEEIVPPSGNHNYTVPRTTKQWLTLQSFSNNNKRHALTLIIKKHTYIRTRTLAVIECCRCA